MAIRTYKVTLDSKNTIAPEPVFLRQGDKTGAVVIDATLMDNGAPVSLSDLTPIFKANTADGQAVIADSTGFNIVNASGGEFTYQVPNALSAVPGKITTAYFSFSDSSGSESTFDVVFIIKKAVDITQTQADDYIMIVDGTLQSLQAKITKMGTDLQSIIDAYNSNAFYSKTDADNKFYSKTDADNNFYLKTDAQTRSTYVDNQLTQIRTIANTNVTADTGWQEEGLTYINGYTRSDGDPVSYRVLQFGANLRKVMLGGWISGPALAKGTKVDCLTLPANIASMLRAKTVQGRFMINLMAGDQYIHIETIGNNLNFENMGTNNDMTSVGGFLELEAWV